MRRAKTISIPRFGALLALLLAAALAVGLLVLVGTKPAEAAFPGTNGKIAFSSDRVTATNPEGDTEIFTMEPDGTNVQQLTDNTESDIFPEWSPDGTQIAFTSDRDDGNFEVYTMEADGDNQTNRTNNVAGDQLPDWQPSFLPVIAPQP